MATSILAYAIGGPALKNKIFWFTDYQGTREVQGLSTGYVTVPTADLRSGNFAGLNAFVDSNGNPTTVNGPPYWAQALSQRLGYTVANGEPYSPANCTSTSNCVFPVGLIPQRGFAPTIPPMKYIPLPNTGSDTFTTAG